MCCCFSSFCFSSALYADAQCLSRELRWSTPAGGAKDPNAKAEQEVLGHILDFVGISWWCWGGSL